MFSPAQVLRSVFSGLGRAVRALENRRAAKALLHLDARALGDIGLTRDAVEGVFENTSLLEDPTLQLSRIAARRGREPAGWESATSPQREASQATAGALPSAGRPSLA